MTTPQYEQCEADLKDADGDVNLHKNLRTASLVGVGLGALATAVGAVLLATAGDPDRYDSVSSHPRRGWKLSGLFGPSGGGLQLRGSF